MPPHSKSKEGKKETALERRRRDGQELATGGQAAIADPPNEDTALKKKKVKRSKVKAPTIKEQLDDLDDLTAPIPEDKAGAKSRKKDKKGKTTGERTKRTRTKKNVEDTEEDNGNKEKKKGKKTQIGAAKLEDGSEQIQLTDEQCSKLLDLGQLISEVKVTVDGQSEKVDEFETILGQVEYATGNLRKICSTCQLIWRIDDFNSKYEQAVRGKKTTLISPVFRTHPQGYQMAVSLCPNGDGRGKGEFMSIFFCIMRGEYDSLLEWPFTCPVIFSVLDQADTHEVADITATFVPFPAKENFPFLGRPTTARNPSLGLPRFVALSDLWSGEYVNGDTIFVRVEVDISGLASL